MEHGRGQEGEGLGTRLAEDSLCCLSLMMLCCVEKFMHEVEARPAPPVLPHAVCTKFYTFQCLV